jgi:leucyl/phenylalanyl-tRNA---protein transferase
MFSHARDASKIALAHLCAHLKRRGFGIIDCQMETAHLTSMGARPIPRDEYLARVAALIEHGDGPGHWPADGINGVFRKLA